MKTIKFMYYGPNTESKLRIKELCKSDEQPDAPDFFRYGDTVLIPEDLMDHSSIQFFINNGKEYPKCKNLHRLIPADKEEFIESKPNEDFKAKGITSNPPDVIETEEGEKYDLSKLKKKELLALAENQGIKIPKSFKMDKIREELREKFPIKKE